MCIYRPAVFFHLANASVEQVCCIKLYDLTWPLQCNNIQSCTLKNASVLPLHVYVCESMHESTRVCVCVCVCVREGRKLIKWNTFLINVIYYCCVAKNLILPTVSRGNESISILTRDTCHRPQDVLFSSLLTACVLVFCPRGIVGL